ncbi:unnamed protein product [Calypogeia fissa]
MNFLLRSSTQINAAGAAAASGGGGADAPLSSIPTEADKDQRPILQSISFNSLHPLNATDFAMGDDLKGAGEFGSIWTRMPIEDHYDFPPDDGCILVPFRDFPENWASAPDVDALRFLDRDFIFPGEQFHVLVHVRAEDPSGPEILTPFKVAAAMNKLAAKKTKQESSGAFEGDDETKATDTETGAIDTGIVASDTSKDGEPLGDELRSRGWRLNLGEISGNEGSSPPHSSEYSSSPTTALNQEGKKKRTLMLLENFRKSHYYTRILKEDEPLWKKRVVGAVEPPPTVGEGRTSDEPNNKKVGTYGCTAVPIEEGRFDPHSAGGIARRAVGCSLLDNGDIVLLLQVTMAADFIADDAFLEVLQYERFEPSSSGSSSGAVGDQLLTRGNWDPTQGLLQWLLPLDRPSSPPPSLVVPIQASPPKVTLGASNSNLFSFGHLRTSSSGSIPALQAQAGPFSTATHGPPIYGSRVWDSVLQERSSKGEAGSEGLLSFRGAVLEPQRFSAHCGLEGPHVPGKRWRRKLSIVQPIKLESYFAHCNTQDLICVIVENVLPPTGRTADVVIYVDSVNIVCQSAAPGSPPLPVPVSCVEAGDDQELPGLSLRVGEQHSFILRPTSPAWKPSPVDDNKHSTAASGPAGREQQALDATQSRKKVVKDSSTSSSAEAQYAVIVSCRCSHTESRLQYRHSLQWRPRLPRDLLVSVSLESQPPVDAVNESQPLFKSQVVTVQATNLTAQDMNLTLLAPSSLANSPLSMVSFPVPLADSPITGYSKQYSQNGDQSSGNEEESEPTSPAAQQLISQSDSSSLPPVQSIESVIGVSPVLFRERNISAADMVADNSPARTHLWLQSVVPLGCVPAFSTTAVKCDILPLTDGIITLDTLHLSANEHDSLYIPESPLQIYTTSSIATGVV